MEKNEENWEYLTIPIANDKYIEICDILFHTIIKEKEKYIIYFKHYRRNSKARIRLSQDDINLIYQLTKLWQTVE